MLVFVPVLDINECDEGAHDCNGNSECLNTDGSYECVCKKGYVGIQCTGQYLIQGSLRLKWACFFFSSVTMVRTIILLMKQQVL